MFYNSTIWRLRPLVKEAYLGRFANARLPRVTVGYHEIFFVCPIKSIFDCLASLVSKVFIRLWELDRSTCNRFSTAASQTSHMLKRKSNDFVFVFPLRLEHVVLRNFKMYKPYFVHRLSSGLCPFHLNICVLPQREHHIKGGAIPRTNGRWLWKQVSFWVASKRASQARGLKETRRKSKSVNALTLYVMFFDSLSCAMLRL